MTRSILDHPKGLGFEATLVTSATESGSRQKSRSYIRHRTGEIPCGCPPDRYWRPGRTKGHQKLRRALGSQDADL